MSHLELPNNKIVTHIEHVAYFIIKYLNLNREKKNVNVTLSQNQIIYMRIFQLKAYYYKTVYTISKNIIIGHQERVFIYFPNLF